ncbi:MAG: thiamine-phosphate kinase, partial [Bacteroidales bacterium]|nr:thiamine-phosphate kinase [Bacteroidales bacterium]
MNKENKIHTISELGEFGLINHLTKDIEIKNKSTLKGIGDDAAVLDYQNKKIVVTTDLLVEGIHFDLTYTPLKHLGYKAAVVNFSDVYAMNAQPKQITLAIALSSKFSLKAVEELYSGIRLACENYDVDFVGGDTSSSLTGLTLSITAIGECENDNVVYRDTAKLNDIVCVSGDLGGAYMGLQLLEREKQVFKTDPNFKPELNKYDYILERQLKPEARRDIIKLLKENNICPTSMIDISDGLSSEVLHICKDSKVGCSIYEEKIPINQQTKDMAHELNINPVVCALNGGEDYELLFTVS